MIFKSTAVEIEWGQLVARAEKGRAQAVLLEILADAEGFALEEYGWELLATDVYRSPEEDAKLGGHGMHPAWRAVDVRIAHWREARALALVAYINARWAYDPSRPRMSVAFVDPHGTGPHIHFQVHELTRRKA